MYNKRETYWNVHTEAIQNKQVNKKNKQLEVKMINF